MVGDESGSGASFVVLGSLFVCDGNCGNYFHPRCVGLPVASDALDDRGEWFCIDCSRVDGAGPDNSANRAFKSLEDSKLGGTVLTAISRLTEQYHVMRLERNKLMLSWQQERKLLAAKAVKEAEFQRKRDVQYAETSTKCRKLAELLSREQAEVSRLRRLQEEHYVPPAAVKLESSDHSSVISEKTRTVISPASYGCGETGTGIHPPRALGFNDNRIHQNVDEAREQNIPKPWLLKSSRKPINQSTSNSTSNVQSRHYTGADWSNQCSVIDRRTEVVQEDAVHVHSVNNGNKSGPSDRAFDVSPIRPVNSKKAIVVSLTTRAVSDGDNILSEDNGKRSFPFSNRLKDLIKSVEMEAVEFAEVRLRQKARERERNSLRTSHSGKRGESLGVSETIRNDDEVGIEQTW